MIKLPCFEGLAHQAIPDGPADLCVPNSPIIGRAGKPLQESSPGQVYVSIGATPPRRFQPSHYTGGCIVTPLC